MKDIQKIAKEIKDKGKFENVVIEITSSNEHHFTITARKDRRYAKCWWDLYEDLDIDAVTDDLAFWIENPEALEER